MMRRTLSVLAVSVFLVAVGVVAAGPAAATPTPTPDRHGIRDSAYVALGDSYSSAAGVAPFVAGSPAACSRSLLNYAHDIATQTRPSSFNDVTCSGAKTSDFFSSQADGIAPQLDAVTKRTRLVTMTIGGNDEGVFVGSFFGCAAISVTDPTGNPCQRKYRSTFTDEIVKMTYPHLVAALSAVRKKAPTATVVIIGYPHILPPVGEPACYPVMPIALGDVPWLNHEQDVLNSVIRKAALRTGARFVDMAKVSVGHDACKPVGQRWIEPAIGPINAYPVHPNATGEAAIARQTLRLLGHCHRGSSASSI
jgi:lysophospholipase L1-like esterase